MNKHDELMRLVDELKNLEAKKEILCRIAENNSAVHTFNLSKTDRKKTTDKYIRARILLGRTENKIIDISERIDRLDPRPFVSVAI